jgi:thiosulfate dehydrogenase
MRAALVVPALTVVVALACTPPPPEKISGVDRGAQLFSDPMFSDSNFNAFSCATCHDVDDEDETPRVGASLRGAPFRPSWWNGRVVDPLDAVNVCFVDFMRGAPLTQEDVDGRALYEYLASLGGGPVAPALPLTIIENVTPLPEGDAARGAEVWDGACRRCHGEPHTGAGRISELAAIVPEDSVEFAAEAGVDVSFVIVEKVRHGQFFEVGGNMPFFSVEALSDDDLSALLGYLAR